MKSLVSLATLMTASLCLAQSAPPAASPATSASTTRPTTRSTAATTQPKSAESAVRALLFFMVDCDRKGVEAVIARNPHAAILWSGPPVPADKYGTVVHAIETMPIRDLSSGEKYRNADGRVVTVTDEMVGMDHRLIIPIFANQPRPMVLSVDRIDGAWRVDATPLIEARQATEMRRRRAEDRQKLPPRLR